MPKINRDEADWKGKIKQLIHESEPDSNVRSIIHEYVYLQETKANRYGSNSYTFIANRLREQANNITEERHAAWNSLLADLKEKTKGIKNVERRYNGGRVQAYYKFAKEYVSATMSSSDAQNLLLLHHKSKGQDKRIKVLNDALYDQFMELFPEHNNCSQKEFNSWRAQGGKICTKHILREHAEENMRLPLGQAAEVSLSGLSFLAAAAAAVSHEGIKVPREREEEGRSSNGAGGDNVHDLASLETVASVNGVECLAVCGEGSDSKTAVLKQIGNLQSKKFDVLTQGHRWMIIGECGPNTDQIMEELLKIPSAVSVRPPLEQVGLHLRRMRCHGWTRNRRKMG